MLTGLGRFCVAHRRVVVAAWLVLLVVGVAFGERVFNRLVSDQGSPRYESYQGYAQLQRNEPYGAQVLALVDGVPVDRPAIRAAVLAATDEIRRQAGVARVLDPYSTPAPQLLARDGRAALIRVDLAHELSKADVDRTVDVVSRRLRSIEAPGARVRLGGPHLVGTEVNEQVQKDTRLGEFIALPLTLLVMIFIFGGLVAAAVPLLGAIVSIAGALVALLGFSYLLDLDPSVVSVVTVLSLGLSIDYSLLIVNRYREERGLGRASADAVARACATAGRTVAFSALTGACALSGLFLFSDPIFRAIAAAGISVIAVAVLAALTLVPALLGLLGGRIGAPSSPLPEDGFFARVARATQRRALPIAVGLGALLLATGVPFLHANFQSSGVGLLPKTFESRQLADVVGQRFPGGSREPILVVLSAPPGTAQSYLNRVARLPGVESVQPRNPSNGQLSVLEVYPQGPAQGAVAQRVVRELRANRPPVRNWVTGGAAYLVDFKAEVAARAPWALGLIAMVMFVLLFLMTGSVLVPVKALVMNVVSLGASFGALVLVFQDGHLSNLLGFTSTGGLETWVPVIVFAFAFGLSMDYEVFLIARIKELYDAGLPNDRAVELGLQRSGRIITSAALLMVIVFAGFAAGKMLGIKEMSAAIALAITVDATLVRCLLVPATMTLLGDANWWAPGPLRRLHGRLGLRETRAAVDAMPAPRGESEEVRAR